MKKILLFAAIALLTASASAYALDIPALSDITTDSAFPTTNFYGYSDNGWTGSSPTTQLWAGTWFSGSQNTNTYLQFTLPSTPISSGILSLYNFENDTTPSSSLVSVYATTTGWNAHTVTWSNQPPTIGSALATTSVNQNPGWYSWNISSYVDSLAPGSTFGLVLTSPGTGHSFYALESTTGLGPKLSVTPEPISLVLFGLGAGVLGLAKFRRKKK